MKVAIDVSSRIEADALKAALEDPATRTNTMVNGMLLLLTPVARQRVIRSFIDTWSPEVAPRDRLPLFRLHDADGTSGE